VIFDSLQYALFLPTVVLVYWTLRGRPRRLWLLGASYLFYGAWDWRFLGLLMFSTAVDYGVGQALGRISDEGRRRLVLAVSVVVNLSILGFFKYFDFFTDSANRLLGNLGLEADPPFLEIILPVGISFYTFQSMSYAIDVYRRRIEPCNDPVLFGCYVAFFPQLVAGPIERAQQLLPQLTREARPPDANRIQSALGLILLGLVKKVVIADQLAPVVERAFGSAGEASAAALVFGVVAFALQIYGDFSGYTDIARGSARLFSIELMHNFREPYLSRSITEFWRRWHISLSTWLRDYLYISIGGNRGTAARTYRNLMITMVLGGLWHGASWTFVAWGALHGIFLCVHRAFGRPSHEDLRLTSPRGLVAVTGTFALVCFAWVFFRAASLDNAFEVLGGIFTLRAGPLPAADVVLVVLLGLVTLGIDLFRRREAQPATFPIRHPIGAGLLGGVAVVALVVASGSQAVPFIYFQF
jgi:D-alanyl-lipoteichoic acid acyltransferase DltB (MBOAT superfamily)